VAARHLGVEAVRPRIDAEEGQVSDGKRLKDARHVRSLPTIVRDWDWDDAA
jgi:hypothetical protein